jgi:hypothetical protein
MEEPRKEEKSAPAHKGGLTPESRVMFNGRPIDLAIARRWLIKQVILKEQQR